MVMRRRSKRSAKRSSKPRYRVRRRRVAKKLFSETFAASGLSVNADGTSTATVGLLYTANIASIPQFNNYKALYQKYRIHSLEWIIVPRWGAPEPNQAEFNLGTATVEDSAITFHYKNMWTNPITAPASELQMLQYNGVRTKQLVTGKIYRIRQRNPTSLDTVLEPTSSGTIAAYLQKNRWCSFDDGQPIDHGTLMTYVVTNSSGTLATVGANVATVYCKVYFEVASPR